MTTMGHKSKKSLVHQVKEVLQTKLHAGESKHLAKQNQATGEKIYSYSTLKTYMKHSCAFAKWAKQEYGCKTLADCRQHVDAYLQYRASYCSPYTVKLDAAAIGKTFGESTTNFVHTPSRIRSEVTRSRGEKGMDKHFSEVKNSNLVDFCRATGLRRSEVKVCTGNALVTCASSPVGLGIHVESGKGGRERIAPLYCDRSTAEKIVSLCEQAGDRRIFDRIHKAAVYMVIEPSTPKESTQRMPDRWIPCFDLRNTIAETTRQGVSMTVKLYRLLPMRSVTIESMWQRATTYTMSDNPFLGSLDRPGGDYLLYIGEIMHSTIARLGAFVFPENIYVFFSYKTKYDYYYQ